MSILPIISMSDLQRRPKDAIASVKDYAVIQSHGRDRAFLLHPELGRILVQTGMLDALLKKEKELQAISSSTSSDKAKRLEDVVGLVLQELSKR